MNLNQKHSVFTLEQTYCELPEVFYSMSEKSNFPNPVLLMMNEDLAREMGMSDFLLNTSDEEKANLLCANEFFPDTKAISQAYCGHQFGYFNILGDGRAKLLGDFLSLDDNRYDVVLKGAGVTPYSGGGDGKLTMSAALREYLISEAMYSLGIPTARSLAITLTGESIYRNGYQNAAVITRIAKSHIRVGTLQLARISTKSDLKALCDYSMKRHYPHLLEYSESGLENRYLLFLEEVAVAQAKLIAKWMLTGFIHGVMNTDNMSISGETIDYGPCAFMDIYHPYRVFSSIDTTGRYRYENQPAMGRWNLARLGEAILPLIHEEEEEGAKLVPQMLSKYDEIYEEEWFQGMKQKLGITGEMKVQEMSAEEKHILEMDDKSLIKTFLNLMQINRADFTNSFVRLTFAMGDVNADYLDGTQELFSNPKFFEWTKKWKKRQSMCSEMQEVRYHSMKRVNPFIIPRNHIVEKVLFDFEGGDADPYRQFLKALKNPYHYDDKNRMFQKVEENPNYRTYCGT